MIVGHVLCSRVLGDARPPVGEVRADRYEALAIEGRAWTELVASGLADELSALAAGLVDRHEDGTIEVDALEALIDVIEREAAYADDALAELLAALRELAFDALDRGVPLHFRID